MNTRLKAPRNRRAFTSTAASSVDSPGKVASKAVIREVSLVASIQQRSGKQQIAGRSRWPEPFPKLKVLVRLPL